MGPYKFYMLNPRDPQNPFFFFLLKKYKFRTPPLAFGFCLFLPFSPLLYRLLYNLHPHKLERRKALFSFLTKLNKNKK